MRSRLSTLIPNSWKRSIRRFAGNRRGSIAVFLAVATIPLIGFLGAATDAARGYMVKARLSQALDAAGLAGAQNVSDATKLASDINQFFTANFPAGFMNSTVSGPTYTLDANQQVLTLNASATIQTTFMRVLGFQTMVVSAQTEVTRKTQYLDVVIAIDMSGSMNSDTNGQTRISAARAAAVELTNTLFGTNATNPLLKIGVVPWNGKVNVTTNGTAFDPSATTTTTVPTFTSTPTWINPSGGAQSTVYYANNSLVPLMSAPPANWQGCVYSRFVNDGDPQNDADILYGSIDTPAGDWRAWEPIGPEGEPVSGGTCDMANISGGGECISCLVHGVTPLSGTKQTVLDAVNQLTSPTGSTNITQGLGWAWRVLMPSPPFTQALTDAEIAAAGGSRVQAIILLTDGENFAYNGDGYKRIWGLYSGSPAGVAMDARLQALATNIKAGGVVIYTIQFANQGTAIQTLLKQIATGPDAPYYHYAPDGDTLKTIFKQVANALSDLRLSK